MPKARAALFIMQCHVCCLRANALKSPSWPRCFLQVRELSLSANQLKSDMQHGRLHFKAGDSLGSSVGWGGGSNDLGLLLEAGCIDAKLERLHAGAKPINCRGEKGQENHGLVQASVCTGTAYKTEEFGCRCAVFCGLTHFYIFTFFLP